MPIIDTIRQHLHTHQVMPFVEFMRCALYEPGLGYYSADLPKFGIAGDFVTAPELTPLFGKALAAQCQQVLARLEAPLLFEFGAGSGRLCVDILKALEAQQALPKGYHILDVSGYLQQRQRDLINQEIPHLASLITWHKQWPNKPFSGVIIANEVLDAMPVHRFMKTKEGLLESMICLDDNEQLMEVFKPCTHQRLLDYLGAILPEDLPMPYQSEANLFVDDWLKSCASLLNEGAFFIIDYGFPRHEYYHPERFMGTLMCHYRHQAHSNPLAHPGEEDITAHVDFTQVAESATKAGFEVAGFTNQAAFLLANGILEQLAAVTDERQRVKEQQAVKQLLQASEMGELVKVIALTKAWNSDLQGFALQDKRERL